MPLATLSKILSSKAFARNSQLYSSSSASATDFSGHHNLGSPSLKTPPRSPSSASGPNKPVPSPKGSIGRSRGRSSKAFTFSLDPFNVVASLRTRSSKVKSDHPSHPESTLCSSSRTVSHQSQSLYSGYEDDEYGEPEVDAEEIRRPSGLGRRASLTDMDMSTEVGDEVGGKYGVDQGSMNGFKSVGQVTEETESRNSTSDMSDMESLVEIRYPSGLGNIKLAMVPSEVERPLSTYPLFRPGVLYYNTRTPDEEVPTPTPSPRQSPTASPAVPSPQSLTPTLCHILSASSYLSNILPILAPYLPPHALTSLARVDSVVGKAARDILWRSISMSVTIRSTQNQNTSNVKNKAGKIRISIDSQKHGHASGYSIDTQKLLDVISTSTSDARMDAGAEDVARLVKSLEMTCRLDCSAPPPVRLRSSLSQKSRPPPLILVPQNTTTPLRPRNVRPGPRQSVGLEPASALVPSTVPVPQEPRSAPLLTAMIPDTHPVDEDTVRTTEAVVPNNNVASLQVDVSDVSPSKKLRRASLMLLNSTLSLRSLTHSKSSSTSKTTSASKFASTSDSIFKANTTINVPDPLRSSNFTSSRAKLRPTSMRLTQPLYLFRSRSVELLGQAADPLTSHSQPHTHSPHSSSFTDTNSQSTSSPSRSADSDTLVPVPHLHLPARARDTQWTPPPEWDRISPIAAVTTQSKTALPSPPPSAPPPSTTPGTRTGTGWRAPSEWHAKPSLSSPPSAFRLTPSPSHTNINTGTLPHSRPSLRPSPSLPSLRAPNSTLPPPARSPTRSRSRSTCQVGDDSPFPSPFPSPTSPVTSVPSPITPYSAISLSAFPLPPPGAAPCLPPFPPEYSSVFPPEPRVVVSSDPSSSSSPRLLTTLPTITHVPTSAPDDMEESDLLPTELATAIKRMVNLEHVTLNYVSESKYGVDSEMNSSNQSPYTSMRESIHLSLVKKANETLGTVIPSLDSLKSLKVVCQTAPYDEVCRTWWEEATRTLENFELEVTCMQGLDGR